MMIQEKENMEYNKRKERKEHPDYTYEKVEEAAKEMEETITKAKYRNVSIKTRTRNHILQQNEDFSHKR